jgi:chaperonin GroES
MMQPLGNRVLIKRAEAKTTKGGILLPDSAKEKPKIGEVVAVGPGKTDEDGKVLPMHVNVGDKVLFSAYAGTQVKHDDATTEYLIMTEEEILGVLI